MRVLQLLFSVIFESFFMVGAGLSIINIRPKISKIAVIGIFCALTIFGVRAFYDTYQIPFGTHSFVLVILFAVILKYIGRQKWSAAIIATLISFLLLILGEGVVMYNVAKLLKISISDIIYKPRLRMFGTILSDMLLIIVFIFGYILKFSIVDLNRLTENEEV